VQNQLGVQRLQASDHAEEDPPDLILGDGHFALLCPLDSLKQVAIICVLHNETHGVAIFVNENFLESNDVGVAKVLL